MNKQALNLTYICLFVFMSVFLCSCNSVLNLMGFDTTDYINEQVLSIHEPESDIALKLSDMTRVLTINTPELPVFKNSEDIADNCRDSILNNMLVTNYAKYTGDIEILDSASNAYPGLQFTAVIPAEDFEETVYRIFGGGRKIKNKSSDLFTYLDNVNAYCAMTQPQKSNVEIVVLSCEETEHTYRLKFQNKINNITSPEYYAVIIKRDDGTAYFMSLQKSSQD